MRVSRAGVFDRWRANGSPRTLCAGFCFGYGAGYFWVVGAYGCFLYETTCHESNGSIGQVCLHE